MTDKNSQNKIAIFASGGGSNAQKIIDHFRTGKQKIKIALIICNNAAAGVLEIAVKEKIPFLIIDRKSFYEHGYVAELKRYEIDLIALAGFLWKLPAILVQAFSGKIINIHPALLPKFGGKGMYGNKVHQAVINSKEKESGITIHYVDEIYDHGEIIFQAKCKLNINETAESLEQKIHQLEHANYSAVIEKILKTENK